MFQNMLNTIQKYTTIIIHRHSRPDGDALGSQIGLKYLLQENFPEKTVCMVGQPEPSRESGNPRLIKAR